MGEAADGPEKWLWGYPQAWHIEVSPEAGDYIITTLLPLSVISAFVNELCPRPPSSVDQSTPAPATSELSPWP